MIVVHFFPYSGSIVYIARCCFTAKAKYAMKPDFTIA